MTRTATSDYMSPRLRDLFSLHCSHGGHSGTIVASVPPPRKRGEELPFLPPELRSLISDMLPREDRATMLSVSRVWRATVGDAYAWRDTRWREASEQTSAVAARILLRGVTQQTRDCLLHVAVRDGQTDVICLLIALGARPGCMAAYRTSDQPRTMKQKSRGDGRRILSASEAAHLRGRVETIAAFNAAGVVVTTPRRPHNETRPRQIVLLLDDARCARAELLPTSCNPH